MDDKFLQFASVIGSDLTYIQGAGGNLSIKNADMMHIKASGLLLSDALHKDIFTEVSVKDVIDKLNNSNEKFCSLNNNPLRPSIETPLHALLPARIVLHVHCIYSIAHSIMNPSLLPKLLSESNWAYIPYARPGLPLAHALQQVYKENNTAEFFILENHGLILTAESIEEMQEKLAVTRALLALPARKECSFDEDFLQNVNNLSFNIPQNNTIHALATDAQSCSVVSKGVLFPDYVVFLGHIIPIAKIDEDAKQAISRINKESKSDVNYLIYPGKGVLINPNNSIAQNDLIHALAQICICTLPDVKIKTLTTADVTELMYWDAEKYRQAMNK